MSDRFGLTRHAAPLDVDRHIELIPSSSDIKGLKNNHFTGHPSEIVLQSPFINSKFPFSRFQPYPCNRCLPFPCRINRFCHVFSPFSPLLSPSPLEGEGWGANSCLLYIKRNRFLSLMRMIRSRIDLQFSKRLPPQTVFGNHSLHRHSDHLGRLFR